MRPACFLLLVVLLALPAAARAEKFRYKYRPGQTVQYRANMAGASMMGQNGGQMVKASYRTNMRHTQRVRSVAGGVVTLEIVDVPVSGTMTAMGRTERYKQSTTRSLVKLTERGRFVSRKTLSGDEEKGSSPTDSLDALYGLNFPERDLKPGDTWEDTFTLGQASAPQTVKVRSRYVGPVVFRGKPCAKFTTTLATSMTEEAADTGAGEGPVPQGRMKGTLTTYFDPAAGLEVYSSGSIVMVAKADLSQVSADAGEFASVMKINVVQSLASAGAKRQE
jgi:hypothetical protein